MDTVAVATSIAGELLARTSSTARVQEMVQLSLTPAFLLAAIGAFLNVMNQRLIWIVERIHEIEKRVEHETADDEVEELPALRERRGFAHASLNLCTAAALMICLVVGLTFVSAFVRPPLGSFVAICWITAMTLVFAGLLSFLLETRLATRSIKATRRRSHKLAHDEDDAETSGGPESP